MEVNLTDDKVEDVMRRIQNDEDAYVTMHGRVLKRSERLKSCEVTDGCTIQVTNKLRGGGRHKNKRSKTETKRDTDESGQKDQQVESLNDKCQEMTQAQKDVLIQTIEGNEGYRRLITTISETENWEYEIRCFRKQLQEKSGVEEEGAKVMEWGVRWAVEARRRRRNDEQEQRRQQEQVQRRHEEQGQNTGQEQGKKDKQVRFGEEEQTVKTHAESIDEHEMMSKLAEVRTGRGSICLVQGGAERCLTNETHRKRKGKCNGGKGEHGSKGRVGSKGAQHVENSVTDEDQENMRAMTSEEEEENHKEDVRKLVEMMQKEEMEQEKQRGRVAPNMGAGGSHLQAEEEAEERRKGTRRPRWADCEDDEGKEEEETEKQKEKSSKRRGKRKSKRERKRQGQVWSSGRRASTRRKMKSREGRRRREKKREGRRRREKKRGERRRRTRSREERRRRWNREGLRRSKREKRRPRRAKERSEGSGRARKTGERGQDSGKARMASERNRGSRGARKKGKSPGGARRRRRRNNARKER